MENLYQEIELQVTRLLDYLLAAAGAEDCRQGEGGVGCGVDGDGIGCRGSAAVGRGGRQGNGIYPR